MYPDTSKTWLQQLREAPDERAWQKLSDLYVPFVQRILSQNGITGHDADDVVQNVLLVVIRRVVEFERQRSGSFRTWLRSITANVLRDHWKSLQRKGCNGVPQALDQFSQQLQDPNSDLTKLWNEEHDRHVLDYLMAQVRPEFAESTWQAFHAMSLENKRAAEVAQELGLTTNAVFIARSRVLKRLREIGSELIEGFPS